jgi:hypothetical protein
VLNHISEDELELYAVSRDIPESRFAALEEHLLVCEVCQDRLQELDEYVAAMRQSPRTNQ